MPKTTVYLKKSNRSGKKWMVYIEDAKSKRGKTLHFGAKGMSDYTIHKDKERMERYLSRHKKRENWGKSGIKTAGFWSRHLLWGAPTLAGAKRKISSKYNVQFKAGWPKSDKKRSR